MFQARADMTARDDRQPTADVVQRDPWTGPGADGLYDPQLEKEACGVGFIVAIDGKRTNKVGITRWIRVRARESAD